MKGEGVKRKEKERNEEGRNRVHGCIGLLYTKYTYIRRNQDNWQLLSTFFLL